MERTIVINKATPTVVVSSTANPAVYGQPLTFTATLSNPLTSTGNVQFNIVDENTLRDAQKNPDKYKNLAVRVSGFSQKFYLLDKTMQDHIISRTKHKTL